MFSTIYDLAMFLCVMLSSGLDHCLLKHARVYALVELLSLHRKLRTSNNIDYASGEAISQQDRSVVFRRACNLFNFERI